MLLCISTGLLLLAVICWYGTSKHQRLLNKRIQKQWRIASLLLVVVAVLCAAQQLSGSATVFFCLLFLMLLVMLVPLATLVKKEQANGR